ncbi:hypothetical protein PIB30_002190 [Stylosanthes scabra]|uniref:Uncharacterized protein n=1 Tax=Stylosanthes scabra TaxID=79078 RepID=A0ABU6S459_9FABA|nr:hypothetical protein [Stylosanthes scabra]
MVKIATKIAFVMILLALVVTNGFGLRKTPKKEAIEKDCPGGCSYLIPVCSPMFPVCNNGVCTCSNIIVNNNHVSTKQERHNVNAMDDQNQN